MAPIHARPPRGNKGLFTIAKYLILKRTSSPVYLTHFVTVACNARCPHCFVNVNEPKALAAELTLDEIDAITKTFGPDLHHVNITGGEPFLRSDLVDIIGCYYRNAGVISILIATNGLCSDDIIGAVRKTLAEMPGLRLVISLSVDHIGERHDSMRGVPGLYKKVVGLYHELSAIGHDDLSVQANITLQKDNQDDIRQIIGHLAGKENISNINLSVIRGGPKDPEALLVDPENYMRGVRAIDGLVSEGRIKGFESGSGRLINSKNIISRENIGYTLRKKKFISDCYAAALSGVLRENGDVFACESRGYLIGNVRDHRCDFKKVWESEKRRYVYARLARER